MIVCPHCGSSVNPEALHCGVCGGALEPGKPDAEKGPAAAQPPAGGAMKRTMIGVAPGLATPTPAPAPAGLKGTMIGMAPGVATPAPAPVPAGLKGTMIGM